MKPHRLKAFQLSNDAQFAEKLEDIVELRLDPPPDSVVWSAYEQCQKPVYKRGP